MGKNLPRLVVAGLSGDSGKTIVTSCLLTALRQKQRTISAFKKGPDYIDAAWLTHLGQAVCRNLDTYLVAPEDVRKSFITHSLNSDIAVIEGNRGLFDGKDADGTHSTAELARLLDAPVLLVVDCTKATRTIAALVQGCITFDPDIRIGGVVLNRLAGERHRRVITEAISDYCHIPVVGALPKLDRDTGLIPGRHLGLVTPAEFEQHSRLRSELNQLAERYLDIPVIVTIAETAMPLEVLENTEVTRPNRSVTVGYFKDSVFTFYYPENLEALEAEGATLVPISSLEDNELPDIDALYIGGGFPETHADRLCSNRSLMASVKATAEKGLPIYAECGGLIYLSRSLTIDDKQYPMADVFPIDLAMHAKPVGHGYTRLKVDGKNGFFDIGTTVLGHEFHYSGLSTQPESINTCMSAEPGTGIGEGRDGLVYRNVLACYTHIHAGGMKKWAGAVCDQAEEYCSNRAGQNKNSTHLRRGGRSSLLSAISTTTMI